ncbi:protein spire isoform X3 [Chironomus tepperi]|uniref:protein spire isoform X3 n=1 Tax=Chironomus tepperi TaxID=113505 RepID=UPI00391F5610
MKKMEENKISNKSLIKHPEILDGSAKKIDNCLEFCCDKDNCLTLDDILRSFNAPLSEEQAWSLIYQSVLLYRNFIRIEFIDKNTKKDSTTQKVSHRIKVPKSPRNLNIHKDGTVHINDNNLECCLISSQKKILLKIGIAVYTALDFNLSQDEECIISSDLEQLINLMTYEEEVDDEGIERDSEEIDDEKFLDSKELDHILELCTPRVLPSSPEEHYRAVCRALATESIELRVFLSKVLTNDTEALRIKADAQSSRQELAKLKFTDWARFWMQVVDELRRGVRLKKINFLHPPTEYALTPYEILMEDIRSRKYQLRKVMVNGDIPPKVKKDAHAVILEFIRSRPPLRKATDRKLAPLKRNPSPREQLLDSIRKGRVLRPIAAGLKNRLLPPTTSTSKAAKLEDICRNTIDEGESSSMSSLATNMSTSSSSSASSTQPTSRRLISVDFSLFKDDETPQSTDANMSSTSFHQSSTAGKENENNHNNINTILRRTTYDLATQCESRRASLRRHTIVGCQSFKNINDSHSVPPSRPQSRQSTDHSNSTQTSLPPATSSTISISTSVANNSLKTTMTPQQQQQQQQSQQQQQVLQNNSNLHSMDTWGKNSLDEQEWKEKLQNDRLSLTLEEIVHIRSVITKAELESLPMGIQIKEDVEKRKLCFLCLRTKFGILGPRGVPCKLCQRTVCAKCYTKMRIPTEHFSNVPVQLLSPSRQNSPSISNAPSPSHHNGIDESFPRSLMERLLRTDVDRKTRNTVGSAPSSPKNQRSTSSTPGSSQQNSLSIINNGVSTHLTATTVVGAKDNQNSLRNSLMSRSMEGPRSLPPQSPRSLPQSNCSTLDRRSTLKKAFTLMQNQQSTYDQKEGLRGELMAVCNDCRGLVLNIIRYSRQTRSSARNMQIKSLTLDLSPVYKR